MGLCGAGAAKSQGIPGKMGRREEKWEENKKMGSSAPVSSLRGEEEKNFF